VSERFVEIGACNQSSIIHYIGNRSEQFAEKTTTPPMKNTASLAEASQLIECARAAGLSVITETETFSCGSFETTTINAIRAGSGYRDEWVQVIVSVRRLGRASVSISTMTNWKRESVRGLWNAEFNLGEIVKGLSADKARLAAEQSEEAAALAETRRCLCA
jgi:hypothetical protein